MKVVHLSHRFWPCTGGVETHVMQLCEHLLADGIETKVVCLDRCPNSGERLPKSGTKNRVRVERLGFLDLGFYRIAPGAISKTRGFDVVHVHGIGFFSDFFALFKLFHRKRLVLSTHGGIFHTKNYSLLKKIYFNIWCRLALRAFDRVIAVSRQDFETFRRIVPEKKIVLIENPVPVEMLSAIPRKAVPNSFLFVGRLSKNKGLENLLDAFSELKKSRRDFSLKIAGSPFDMTKEELREMILKKGLEGMAEVLGAVSEKELLELYAGSEFFVSASEYEGFGISAVEAMAAGLIPILNGIPAFREFVTEGETGFIADFSSRERAAKKLGEALGLKKAERQAMGRAARAFSRKFCWKNSLKKFEKAYGN
ncbi:MAG: glycosyltransferase family 4 protein [archaeon]